MISKRQRATALAALMLAATAAMAEPSAEKARNARDLFTARAEALRAASAKDAAVFAGFLSKSYQADGEAVRRAWGGISTEFTAAQLRDFFVGANVLVGPVSQQQGKAVWAGVLALFNPWWDAILIMRLGDDLRVDRLAFFDGEAFRGGAAQAPSAKGATKGRGAATVFPADEPLSSALMRVQSGTAASFREFYPGGSDAWAARIPPRGVSRDRSAPKARSELRLRQLGAFLAGSGNGGKAVTTEVFARACAALRLADAAGLRRFFADPARAAFCDSFAQFPADIRKGFSLYGYVPAEKGTLFVFLNPDAPNVYATVSFPKNRESDPKAGDVAFEWFDLVQADAIVKALKTAAPPAK